MDYQRREWLQDWGGAHIFASIEDDVPDLQISDGLTTVGLCHYHSFDKPSAMAMQGHEQQLMAIRTLIEVLSEFHSRYLEALHPDSVSHGSGIPGAGVECTLSISHIFPRA